MIRDLPVAQVELADVVPLIRTAVQDSLEEFMRVHGAERYRYSARTEASLLHDLMVFHSRQHLEGVSGVNFFNRRNLFLIGIRGRWVIRLKKLNSSLKSSNIPTQQSLNFLEQVQLPLPGAEGPTNLQVGYQRSGAEITTAPIWMTCPDGNDLAWAWCLEEAESDFGAVSPVFPQAPVAPVAPVAPRVRPRVMPADGSAGARSSSHGRRE